MNKLQEIELQEIEATETDVQQSFEIMNLDALNWAFRKVAAIKAKMADNKALADAERARIDEWEQKENGRHADSIAYFEQKIAEYHQKVLAEDPKQKTLSTPYGKSKSTSRKPSLKNMKDSEELLAYAERAGEQFVRVKKEVAWAELKKILAIVETEFDSLVVDGNGEIVPGVIVEPATTTFKVEVE